MRGAPQVYNDFSGGVNLDAAPYLIEDNQARDALNVHTDFQTGQLRKRHGLVTLAGLNTSPALFVGPAHSLAASNLTPKNLIAVGPTTGGKDRIVTTSPAGTVTKVSRASEYTANTRWSFAQAAQTSNTKGPIFAMNGVDTPQYWTGSGLFTDWTAASGTVPLTGNFLIYAGSRLWCAELAAPGRVRYSGITGTSPDTGNWDADGFVDLDPSDGEEITAIGRFGPYLFVFKPTKVHVITDTVTGANRVLSASCGTISPRSVVETDVGLIFYDIKQGVYSTNGSRLTRISDPLAPLLRQIGALETTAAQAAATYSDGRYYLSVSTDGNRNNLTLEYDTIAKSWWIHDCACNAWAVLDPLGNPVLYGVDAQTPRAQTMFENGTFTDAGAKYAGGSFFTGPWFIWDRPHTAKRVREVRIDGSGNWRLGYATNFDDDFSYDDGEVWFSTAENPMLFAPSTDDGHLFAPSMDTGDLFAPTSIAVTDRRYYTLGVANAWSMQFVNDDTADFQIFSETVAIGARTD
jgi:hypothetical protein